MFNDFPLYTTDYISGVMSLRKPQTKSLKILEEITNAVPLRKGMNLKAALGAVHAMYPICTDFERDFMSLTFALATGVGKTRLMGAFIAYLYTQHNIRNFFVVAPNTTIYEKLKKDLSDNGSPKYVFRGLGCFTVQPQIITDDDYREKNLSLFESDVHIFVYNIDKFNKEGANMKKVNELIGDSFYQALSDLPDLVLIMDESHHYRAERGMQALNELHPLLGLELTATPLVTKGNKQVPFKNVVYEYPLSKAIEDGYTRTPFAVTRSDIDFYNFGDEQLDKMMLLDGITCHESTKRKLEVYAVNHGKPVVKPFMLVVCKDTDHATWVEQFVKSDEFRGGAYRNKTIVVHSKQKGAETEANTRLLLDVENPENPVEIVIHVNMLKEGWDVNNLYTIVPLRTAASKILREQMVGRGLRLPYGERTGDRDVDAVMLTAHDKFNDILAEAQKGDSIFKAGNVIKVEEIKPEEVVYTQLTIDAEPDAEAVALLAPYKARMDSVMYHVVGTAEMSMDRFRPESLLSNLIADVLREAAVEVLGKPADMGLINIGGIRNSLTEGDITTENIYEILPFENSLCVLTMKGSAMKHLFENIAVRLGEGVSGIQLEISKDGKLLQASIAGKPVEDDRDYTVATIDYLADGNDGMTAFLQADKRECPDGATLRGLFMKYVEKQTAAGKKVTSRMEGRVVVKE